MPADIDRAVEEAIAATTGVESAELTERVRLGPQTIEVGGEMNRVGAGQSTASTDGPSGRIDVEFRSDGETAWIRTDQPTFVERLPEGVRWVEGSYRELVATGVLGDFERTWAPLLFLRGLGSVEDGGIESVAGEPVRVLHGSINYEEAFDAATSEEQAAMDFSLNLHAGVQDFDAEVALDDQGRVRRLDYDIDFGPPGARASIPVGLTLRVARFDVDVEPPEPPEPGRTVAAADVPDAMDVLRGTANPSETVEGGGVTTTSTEPSADPPSDAETAAEVLDREPPDPAPPPPDTPPDAVEITTLIEGRGRGAEAGDGVVVHYVGVTADGQVFDSSWERGQAFPLSSLGEDAVIDGWNEGLIGVRVGERRRLVIGADKAYGAGGTPDGAIPPNAPLAFEVDVVDVTPGGG